MDPWYLKGNQILIIMVLFFGYFGEVSSTPSISISLSIPYTVLLFDIVGISQGYITRTIRSAYSQPENPTLSIDGLANSASSSTIPPTKHILKEQPPLLPPPPSSCIGDVRTCTSEKEVCLLGNYSKFQLPNKGKQTVVSIGEIIRIINWLNKQISVIRIIVILCIYCNKLTPQYLIIA